MASVSTFFTPYSALRGTDRVEAIAIIVTEAPGREPEHLYVVLDELGVSSLARPDELTLYGGHRGEHERRRRRGPPIRVTPHAL